MRIVIFGGTGNIGTALVRRLAAVGHDVRAVARRTPDEPARIADGVEWVSRDITRDDLDPVVSDTDVVVHLAWRFQPIRDPASTWRTNVVGTERVLEAVERAGTPALVYSSSVAAYSPRGDDTPVDERYPTHGAGVSAYAREKAYVERLLDAFELRCGSTRTVRVRPAFAFQRDAAAEQWRLFIANPRLRRLFDTRLVPAIPLPAELAMQVIHAADLAEAFAAAVEGTATGAYNVAAADVLHAPDIATLLHARCVSIPARRMRPVIGAAWRTHASKAPPDLFDTLLSLPIMSTQRATQDLGWRPENSAADAVGAFLTASARRTTGPTPKLAEAPADPHDPDDSDDGIDTSMSKEQLYRRAQQQDITGRSAMNKQELATALQRATDDESAR